jgi:hypothetical protein
VRGLFKSKFKFKESDDRTLKFMNNLGFLNNESQLESLKKFNFDINIYPSALYMKQDYG